MKHYDAVIIGFGKAGKTLAADYAKRNMKVALIERSSEMYGGTCINVGCIPSKSLILQAVNIEFEEAMKNKNMLISKLRKKNYDKLNDLNQVDVIDGEASFKNDHEIIIKKVDGEEIIYGDKIFINTGSTSIIPNIEGVKETKHVFTSREALSLEKLPKRLAIIGGGYIGLEFSSMYARYGSEVSVFENGERLVKREDEDVASMIQTILEDQGVTFHFETKVKKFENVGELVKIIYDDKDNIERELVVDAVLLATGRKANTAPLHLEHAKVEMDARGNINVDETLKTNVDHIYAMGDVKGGLQFTYISLDDYRIIASHLFGDGSRNINNRGVIPYSVFISPVFSRVGLSEQEANMKGYEIKKAVLPVAAIPRANVNQHPIGMMKAIVDAKTDMILGCVLLSDASEELINTVQLAMNANLSYKVLANHIFTHPTMSESLNDLFGAIN